MLSRKYFKKWRVNAWSTSLTRKGRDRRRNFAKSIQDLACSTRRRQSDLEALPRSVCTARPNRIDEGSNRAVPAEHNYQKSAVGVKRKLGDTIMRTSHQTPKQTKINHRHSHTSGNSSTSASPYGISHSPRSPRRDIAGVAEGSLLDEILMKQARRLAPTARSDTTKTDYFRLKALGIDPDTPIVPRTKERVTAPMVSFGEGKSVRVSPERQAFTSRQPASRSVLSAYPSDVNAQATVASDEDALFAQIRSVREALAESEKWFQSERQSIERSLTSLQTEVSLPNSIPDIETPAQRKLKEIKQRGPIPSRSELRIQAMGDRALLPNGFWDGPGMELKLIEERSKTTETRDSDLALSHIEQRGPGGSTGFAALAHTNGISTGGVQRQKREEQKGGVSAEDAIEL